MLLWREHPREILGLNQWLMTYSWCERRGQLNYMLTCFLSFFSILLCHALVHFAKRPRPSDPESWRPAAVAPNSVIHSFIEYACEAGRDERRGFSGQMGGQQPSRLAENSPLNTDITEIPSTSTPAPTSIATATDTTAHAVLSWLPRRHSDTRGRRPGRAGRRLC